MKNFVLEQALGFEGSTLESFLDFLGRAFLGTYPDMGALHVTGRESRFEAASVPDGDGFSPSTVLFSRSRDDYGAAELLLERTPGGVALTDHECGRLELQLLKTTGSSFASFARDAHTTLPETQDRPLYLYLDVFWRYTDPAQMVSDDTAHYVPAEQVRDLAAVTFHNFNSRSIQHLVYEMGTKLLERFPQLAEVRFEAQNRLWDKAFESDDPAVQVRTDPRPPYGQIGLTLTRDVMARDSAARDEMGTEAQVSGLSTHVLDTARGRPAAGVSVQLWRLEGETRSLLETCTTNEDGRAALLSGDTLEIGVYELIFAVGAYSRAGQPSREPAFLEDVVVRFGVSDAGAHYHVPLLVSPYSYSTYRGS